LPASDTENLHRDRDRYVAFAYCWADVLIELDPDMNIVFASGALSPLLGRAADDLMGASVDVLLAPSDMARARQVLITARDHGRGEGHGIRLQGAEGVTAPMAVAAHCLDERAGHFSVGFRLRPTESESDRAHGVARDPVSGLYDTASFEKLAEQKLSSMRAAGTDIRMTVMSMPELDTLRDRLPADEQDPLLSTIGAILKVRSADGDTATRVGETGFGLLHDAGVDIDSLSREIAEFSASVDPEGTGLDVEAATVDAGDAEISDEDMAKGLIYTLNQFREASGRGLSIRNLSRNFANLAKEGVARVQNFKNIVAAGAFQLVFHPIINIGTGNIHHYEALARFGDAEASPFREITFAEESDLIFEFDIAMVRKVVDWLSRQPRNSDAYHVAVNVSGNSIDNDYYVDSLHRLLGENEWAKGKLLFETTESARMSDLDHANAFIQGLRDRGHEVCLDDFGAGSASFQYLASLEVDVVKLDGSAVQNARKSPKGQAFLSALTELCRRLDVETVAEMVDSPECLSFVRDCGVDYVQGFLFGKPSRNLKDFDPLPHRQLMRWN